MRRVRRIRRQRRRKPLSRRWERKRQMHFLRKVQGALRHICSYVPAIVIRVFRIAVICLLAFILVWNLGQRVSMIGDSMSPALKNGDIVLVNRVVYNARRPRRGDVIVFKPKGNENSHYYIKRVIALPGETVEIIENGIYINGEKLEETYQTTKLDRVGRASEKIKLDEDEYFVLGDDRENSEDSRDADVGNVKREYIYGKAWFVLSPRQDFGFIRSR